MSGLGEQVWPEFLARNPGRLFNLENPDQRDTRLALAPVSSGGVADPAHAGEVGKAQSALGKEDFEVGHHPDDSFTTFNPRQAYSFNLSRFLQGRSPDEIDRIMATLETAFPKKRMG